MVPTHGSGKAKQVAVQVAMEPAPAKYAQADKYRAEAAGLRGSITILPALHPKLVTKPHTMPQHAPEIGPAWADIGSKSAVVSNSFLIIKVPLFWVTSYWLISTSFNGWRL